MTDAGARAGAAEVLRAQLPGRAALREGLRQGVEGLHLVPEPKQIIEGGSAEYKKKRSRRVSARLELSKCLWD